MSKTVRSRKSHFFVGIQYCLIAQIHRYCRTHLYHTPQLHIKIYVNIFKAFNGCPKKNVLFFKYRRMDKTSENVLVKKKCNIQLLSQEYINRSIGNYSNLSLSLFLSLSLSVSLSIYLYILADVPSP